MDKIVRLRAEDNVVVANRALEAGHEFGGIVLRAAIPAGHKIASCDIPVGARILKYGQTIGYAMSDIPSGTHLHTHNVEFRATDAAYQFGTNLRDVAPGFSSGLGHGPTLTRPSTNW